MNWKQWLRWGAAVLSVLALAAVAASCGGGDGSTSGGESSRGGESDGAGGTVAVFEPTRNAFDFCKNKSIAKVVKGAGYEVDSYFSEFDPATSNQNIEDALTKGIDGATYTGQTAALDTQSLGKLAAAGIPTVMNIGATPEGAEPAVSLPASFTEAGMQAVETMVKLKPDVEHVALIAGVEGTEASDETLKGLEEGLARQGIEPEAVEHGDYTSQGGAQVAQDLLQAHPDIEVIITLGDDMALGEAHVAQAEGSAQVIDVYGFGQEALKALEEGRLLAMVYAPVDEWGTKIGEAMVRTMKGESGPKSIDLTLEPVDETSVAKIESSC